MAYQTIDRVGVNQNIAETSTTKYHNYGERVRAVDPTYGEGEFIYLLGLASTAAGDVVVFNEYTGATTRITARSKGPVAVAMSACVASNYGWYQVVGNAVAKAGTIASAQTAVYAAGAGAVGGVDDTVVAGDEIHGAVYATTDGTPSAGFAVITINNPWLGDTDNT